MGKQSYWKRKHKRALAEILLSGVLLAAVAILDRLGVFPVWWASLLGYLIPYLIIGRRVAWKAARNMVRGNVFDENFLMTLATVGALCTGEYPEAVFVMLFYRVGELFEELAVGKSRQSISALMEIRPDAAHVERGGELLTVEPSDIAVDEVIVVRPGERVPLDGEIIEGQTTLDTAALTGESLPREAGVGEAILSGCINLSGLVRVRVAKPFGESTVSKILKLVENSGANKSKSEHFITRFARIYTPAVVIAAVALAVLPPLFLGIGDAAVWKDWVMRAMSFLVISCPCALVISVPLSFFGGIGGASRRGILVKGSSYLEALAHCDTVVFDKTGTLTEGRFSVVDTVAAPGFTESDVRTLAAAAEQFSSHPIALALAACAGCAGGAVADPASVEEVAGHGVRATVYDRGEDRGEDRGARRIAAGNLRLMEAEGANPPAGLPEVAGTVIHVAVDGVYAGRITVADAIKPDAPAAISGLRREGITRTVMLTGDSEAVASAVASSLGVDEYHAGLLPADKVERVEALLTETDGKLAFVGDGINDAPVLARADIGVAMGALGSDAAIEAADIVLMDDRPSSLPTAMRIARKTLRIVRQNIVFALSVKAAVLILGALGLANLWLAVFADVGVAVLAILNAMRALKG